jgi:hypothetical protein
MRDSSGASNAASDARSRPAVAHLVLVRPMRIPMKARKIVIGVILLPILLVGGCAARVWIQDTVAKRFCESLVPKIEQDRA